MRALNAVWVLLFVLGAFGVHTEVEAVEKGLVAHYSFDEGAGSVAHDLSGNGNHGEIHGATFAKNGDGYALEFDGVDDFVDCGDDKSADLTRRFSVALWVFTYGPPLKGEPLIVGKRFSAYALSHGPSNCYFYGRHPHHARAMLNPGEWHHVAGTYDEGSIKIYVDGKQVGTATTPYKEVRSGGHLMMGSYWQEKNEWAAGAMFKGKLDGVRIYNRPIGAAEVKQLFLTTNLSGLLDLKVTSVPPLKLIAASINTRGLGELPDGTTLRVELTGGDGVRDTITVENVVTRSRHYLEFDAAKLAPGAYRVRAAATDKAGTPVGRSAISEFHIQPAPAFPKQGPYGKILNNLVTETVNIRDVAADTKSLAFTNPRDGWVFISCTAAVRERDKVALAVKTGAKTQDWIVHDGSAPPPPAWQGTGTTREAMRQLAAGPHELLITRAGSPKIRELIVRAVPEMIYVRAGARPRFTPEGPRDFEYLGKHVLPHVNAIVTASRGGLSAQHRPHVEQWKDAGRRAITEASIPFLHGDKKTPISAEHAYKFWNGYGGYADPLLDGILADEFCGGYPARVPAWTEAVLRTYREKGKAFYPYCGNVYHSETIHPLLRAAVKTGGMIAWERYLKEQATAGAAWRLMQDVLAHGAMGWREQLPDVFGRLIICFGYFSTPLETLNAEPGADFKVFMDLEANMVATHPAFEGVGGFMHYTGALSDDETARWAARLYRHYGIEGKTGMLSKDPYCPKHIVNPDFREGTDGWAVNAAEPGSIRADDSPGFGWLQGRYPEGPEGDTVLVVRRSTNARNRVRQTMKDLEPDQLYSLKLISADFKDMSKEEKHAIRIEIAGATLLPEKCYAHVFNNYYHCTPRYPKRQTAWMNYRRLVFRARGERAGLTISDWKSADEPGGPIGQELMINFVEVQPYIE